MGYILPIAHFEYADYQKRVIKDKEEFHYVEKPYKLKLDTQKNFKYDQNFTNRMIRESKQRTIIKVKLTNPEQEKIIARITGKGSLVNESI